MSYALKTLCLHCIIIGCMKFVDRIDEAARLKDALAREKSSLVVVYGRRRLGKSTLIKRVLSNTDVYFLADRSEGQHQRILLAKVIAQVFPDFDKLTYPDWEAMFRALNYRTDERFTLDLSLGADTAPSFYFIMGASSIINPITVMRHHLQSTINYTDCICRPNTGRRNRYVRLSIYNRFIFILTDAYSRLTTGSNDTSAALDCAAEPERMSRTEPIITRLSECESTEAEVQYLKGNSSVRRSRFSRHGIPAVKQNYQGIRPQRSGIMPLFTRYSGCNSGIPYSTCYDSSRESCFVADKLRMRSLLDWIFQNKIRVKLRHQFFRGDTHPLISAYFVFTE